MMLLQVSLAPVPPLINTAGSFQHTHTRTHTRARTHTQPTSMTMLQVSPVALGPVIVSTEMILPIGAEQEGVRDRCRTGGK